MPSTEIWDRTWIQVAIEISQLSKDPSTKVGSVIVTPNNRQCSIGFNGMVMGIHEPLELWENREQKYIEVIHSEENNLLFCPFNTAGCKIYITHEPCIRCMIRLLQSGIVQVTYMHEYPRKADSQELYNKYKNKFQVFQSLQACKTD